MSDTGAVDLAAPPSEPVPPSQNEFTGFAPAPAQTSAFEKIKRRVAGVFESHGVTFQRGRGRPRLDGRPAKGDIPINAPATALPAPAAPGPAVPGQEGLDPILVRKVCGACLKGLAGFLDKLLHRKAKSAGLSPVECNQLVVDTTITREEMDGFSELAEICLRKYGVGSQYAPEIGLAVIVGGIGIRYGVALKAFEPDAPKIVPLPGAKPPAGEGKP